MLQEFITSAIVIDDDFKEVEKLIYYLEDEKDIWVKYYSPDDIKSKVTAFNNRKIIFLDLYLDDSRTSIDNIAQIRKYFKTIIGENFGTYGIVLWTKHTNHFDDFCDKIFKKNNPFTLPLFVIPLDKTKYKKNNSFEGVLNDLEKGMENDVHSSFFVEWNKAVKIGSDNTISTLYNLFETNDKKNKHLESVMHSLALNFTGIPIDNAADYNLQKDLVKSLMDTLQFEITNSYKNVKQLFDTNRKLNLINDKNEESKVFSKLNSLLLLDYENLHQDIAIPGNVYELNESTSPLYIKELLYKKNMVDIDEDEKFKGLINRRICVEMTPPCDFALNKKQSLSRIIGGIQMDFNKDILKGNDSPFKTDNYYTFLYPVNIDGYDNPQMIIFDFYRFQTVNEGDLKDSLKYKIIMKAKDKLFADILQKLSSHTARLGLSVLYP